MNGLDVSRVLRDSGRAFCVIVMALAIAACATQGARNPGPPPPTAATTLPPRSELPNYFRLPNMAPERTPVRVALLLPFSSSSAETRALANAIEKSAELAVFDSGNPDILLMPIDDGGTTGGVATAANRAIAEGAEIILGPL